MTEHLCVLCPARHRGEPNHYERAQACEPCRVWLGGLLRDIAELWAQLPIALQPGQGHGQRVSGSREAPLPLKVDVLDLTLPTRNGSRAPHARGVLGLDDDQTGHLSAGTILDTIARTWIGETWCRSDHLPVPTVPALLQWLSRWMGEACDAHPAVDEDAGDLIELRATLRAYVPRVVEDEQEPPAGKPERRLAPCPGCERLSLWWFPRDRKVHCDVDDCARVMTEEEYDDWAKRITHPANREWLTSLGDDVIDTPAR